MFLDIGYTRFGERQYACRLSIFDENGSVSGRNAGLPHPGGFGSRCGAAHFVGDLHENGTVAPNRIGRNTDGSTDNGCLQINDYWHFGRKGWKTLTTFTTPPSTLASPMRSYTAILRQ
jgi:hypothetical protein